jgi:ABC-2 type transport system ATP-binding protein
MAHSSAVDQPALSFDRVSKAFGPDIALDDVSLVVRRGELFGLVGGNGAGKTTLIKCLLDFCTADAGRIEISGVSSRLTSARAPLAFLPERFSTPHYLTGSDFLKYMAELHGRSFDEERVPRILEALDLDRAALVRPSRAYSKGMTQKLGLAACLLSDKPIQVLDEPMSGLDPKARVLLKRSLKTLTAGGGTVFLTSHALADVHEICDRMAVLHEGRLRFVGTPAQLIAEHGGIDLEHAFLACIGEPQPA